MKSRRKSREHLLAEVELLKHIIKELVIVIATLQGAKS